MRQPPVPKMMAVQARSEAADAVPIEAGENAYRVQVNVSFAINQ